MVLRMPVKLLVSLLSHHPHVSRELYLVMRALEDGRTHHCYCYCLPAGRHGGRPTCVWCVTG